MSEGFNYRIFPSPHECILTAADQDTNYDDNHKQSTNWSVVR